jgi:hypothetical protein
VKTYLSNTSNLKTQINKELGKQRELSRLLTANPRSPLDFLKELSAKVPKDVVVDMTSYSLGAAPSPYLSGEDSANLTFVIQAPQTADRLNAILGPVGLKPGKLEETPAPAGTPPDAKRWKVTYSGKPTEDSYGK